MSQSLPSQNAYRVSNHLTTYTRDEFHLAAIVQNLKTLALPTRGTCAAIT